jgi:hypothetical protein
MTKNVISVQKGLNVLRSNCGGSLVGKMLPCQGRDVSSILTRRSGIV